MTRTHRHGHRHTHIYINTCISAVLLCSRVLCLTVLSCASVLFERRTTSGELHVNSLSHPSPVIRRGTEHPSSCTARLGSCRPSLRERTHRRTCHAGSPWRRWQGAQQGRVRHCPACDNAEALDHAQRAQSHASSCVDFRRTSHFAQLSNNAHAPCVALDSISLPLSVYHPSFPSPYSET